MYSFTSIVGLGLDSFLACTVIGSRSLAWREQTRIAFAFGACDAAATLLGSLWPHPPLEVSALALWLLATFLFLRIVQRHRSLIYLLPVLFSLDNLFAGNPASSAPVVATSSASMAFLGLCLASACQRALRSPTCNRPPAAQN